jgi:hypothetical protein
MKSSFPVPGKQKGKNIYREDAKDAKGNVDLGHKTEIVLAFLAPFAPLRFKPVGPG